MLTSFLDPPALSCLFIKLELVFTFPNEKFDNKRFFSLSYFGNFSNKNEKNKHNNEFLRQQNTGYI